MSDNAPGRSPAELQAAADRARRAYDHEKAVALYTRALEKGDLPPELEYELRDGRSWCNERLALFETADADLQVMLRLAEGMGDVRRRIESHARRSRLANRASAPKRAEAEGRAGLALAREAGAKELESQILAHLAVTAAILKRPEQARHYAERALALARKLDDPYSEAWALLRNGNVEWMMGRLEQAHDYIQEALPIARRVGDPVLEAHIHNMLGITTWDVSQRRHYGDRAVALAERIDDRPLKATLYNNLGFLFHNLGLYQRGRDYARRAVDLSQGQETSGLAHLFTLAECYLGLGQTDLVRSTVARTLPITREVGPAAYGGRVTAPFLLGLAALEDGRPAEARNYLQEAQQAASEEVPGTMYADATTRMWLAAAELALGNVAAARAYTRDIPETDSRTYPPQQMWWWRYRALAAGEDRETVSDEAWQALERARELMLENVATLSDEGLRRNYLNKVAIHRDITLAWAEHAVLRGVSLAPFTDREVASGNLQEQMTRLMEIGTRLAAHRDPQTLAQFLIEEFVELSGAERALLLLAGDEDEGRVAASFTAREEAVSGARTLARPLLQQMQWERQAVLRQEEGEVPPGGVPECHLRSLIALPLLARGNFMGLLYGDMRHIFGRFDQADVELLTLLANQAAAALENAEWTQTLEQRVARRTEDLQAANEQLQQQNAELAVINVVQEGLVAQMDMEAIFDLVGDTIYKIFDTQSVIISTFDHPRETKQFPYFIEKGKRFYPSPTPFNDLQRHLIRTRQPVVILENAREKAAEFGMGIAPGTEPAKSMVFVPLAVGEQVNGFISLQNVDREHAFSDSDVRLLSTLANSMSVALENARLFEETQRLLEETEERNAELAIINNVQSGLAAQLDMQGIYDLVGDEIRHIFDAQVVTINRIDHERWRNEYWYAYEKGQRLPFYSEPVSPLIEGFVAEGKTLLINEGMAEILATQGHPITHGEAPRSVLAVPLRSGDKVTGYVSLQNIDREHAFDRSHVRLLETLTNSMSVALENARLFDETQRLVEAEQRRVVELEIINSVQEGLASKLELQAIYDLVGDKLREIFQAETTFIAFHDPLRENVHAVYYADKDAKQPFSRPYGNSFYGVVVESAQPMILGTREEAKKLPIYEVPSPGSEQDLNESFLGVPIIRDGEPVGAISVQSYRKNAYDRDDLRLLTTLVNSMTIALENARLFDETQRLVEVEQRRVAELEIINSVQEGLASKLELQAIYDLVGDKLREIFQAETTFIAFHDPLRENVHAVYYADKDAKQPFSRPYGNGTYEVLVESAAPCIWGTREERPKHATYEVPSPGSEQDLNESQLGAPIIRDGEPVGAVSVQSYRKNAYDRDDLRLLTTLVNSMTIALENARLFDETQRHAREMAALAEVGRDISATLDLPTVLERIAGHARELLAASDSAVFLPAEGENEMRAFVALGSIADQVKATVVRRGEGIIGDLWQRGEAEVLSDAGNDPRALRIEGTEEQPEEKMMVAPLLSGDQVAGMMVVWRAGGDPFAEADLAFLEGLARQAAIAIENAGLYSEAEAARRTAEEANKSKSEFLANVSHELRTPLTSILGFARLVQKRLEGRVFPQLPDGDERLGRAVRQIGDNLEIILGEGQRLTTLINNVLDLEKIEAGQMEWTMSPLSVAEVVDQAAQATNALVEQSGLVLVQDVPQDLPEITGDRDKLVQVVINLIANAVKFTEAGAITCRARLKGAEVWISVEDAGTGIRPEDLDMVFEKFRQVGDTLTDKPKGTGLGLPICKEIVERHGGRIWVESRPGEGSTFTFTLPVAGAVDAEGVRTVTVDDLLGHLKQRLPATPEGSADGRKTLLVADDDASIRELLRQELSAEGYQVFEADNGREALAQIQALQPDLVILDVLMPELSGFDVAAVVKNDPQTMGVPVVILSVLEDKERGFRLGVDRYLTKPIDMPALLREVEALLAQGTSHRRVLVVDEDAQTVQTVSEALQAQGYEVTAVTGGEEGIQEALALHPDMIIVNAHLSQKHDMVQAIRFERGLENVLFLLVQ